MSDRALYLVDAMPSASPLGPRQQMHGLIQRSLGEPLAELPCSTTPRWLVDYHARGGEYGYEIDPDAHHPTDDDDDDPDAPTRWWRHAPRSIDHIGFRGFDDLAELVTLVRRLRQQYGLPTLRLQVPVPSPIDLAGFITGAFYARNRVEWALAAWRAWTLRRNYHWQLLDAVDALASADPDALAFQVELPRSLAGLRRFPWWLRPLATRLLARHVARFVAQFPLSSPVVLHPCYRGSEPPAVTERHLALVTRVVRRVAREVRRRNRHGRVSLEMPAVHISATAGDSKPPRDAATYAPLARIPDDVRVYAGVAHYSDSDASRAALDVLEHALGRTLDAVSTPCGTTTSTARNTTAAVRFMDDLASKPPA
jgi:hypothetical protein